MVSKNIKTSFTIKFKIHTTTNRMNKSIGSLMYSAVGKIHYLPQDYLRQLGMMRIKKFSMICFYKLKTGTAALMMKQKCHQFELIKFCPVRLQSKNS